MLRTFKITIKNRHENEHDNENKHKNEKILGVIIVVTAHAQKWTTQHPTIQQARKKCHSAITQPRPPVRGAWLQQGPLPTGPVPSSYAPITGKHSPAMA